MNTAMDALIEAIKADYAAYHNRSTMNEIKQRMIEEFNESVSYTVGKKYIKVVKNGSVWGFVVAVENDAKFPQGTILKAAGWAAPARNFARGNVFVSGYTSRWTGA